MGRRAGRPLRITFVLPYADMSGGIRVASIYAQRLQERGHDVFAVSVPKRPYTLRQRAGHLVRGRWPRVPQGPSHFENTSVPHHVIERSRPVMDKDVPDADVVIATWWETAYWISEFSGRKGVRALFLQGYEAWTPKLAGLIGGAWRLPVHKIAVSQWLVGLAASKFGDPNAGLVPNAVDHDQFNAPPRGKQPQPTIGLLYATATFKGCDISLRAFEMASRRVPNVRLVSFGAQPVSPELPLPSLARYVQAPPQDQLRELYAACDAWLFGSRQEGFGLPILEAMACRTPVIGTPAGAAPELLRDGRGILVPPEDPKAMAEAIERIARMPDADWRDMSDKAHAATQSYTWDDASDLFEAELYRAIDRSQRGEIAGQARSA